MSFWGNDPLLPFMSKDSCGKISCVRNKPIVYVVIYYDWCNRAPHCTTVRGKKSDKCAKNRILGTTICRHYNTC